MHASRVIVGFVAAAVAVGIAVAERSEELPAPTRIHGATGSVSAIAFSADGSELATGDGTFGKGNGTVRFWKVGTWQEIPGAIRHQNKITAVAYSPDGKQFASTSLAEFLRPPALDLRGLRQPSTRGSLDNEAFAVWDVAISPDGRTLASAHSSGRVKLWEIPEGTLRVALERHGTTVVSLRFSPGGEHLASGDAAGVIKIWDVAAMKEVATFPAEKVNLSSVAFSADGKSLAVGAGKYDPDTKTWSNGEIRIHEVPGGALVRKLAQGDRVAAVVFTGGGRWLAAGGGTRAAGEVAGKETALAGQLKIWNRADWSERAFASLPAEVLCLATSPDGKYLAAGCEDTTVRIWDLTALGPEK